MYVGRNSFEFVLDFVRVITDSVYCKSMEINEVVFDRDAES